MILIPEASPAPDDLDRMRHPDEALATILAHTHLLKTELVPLIDSSWRILANDLVAAEPHPPFPAATMDGYAVISDDGSPWRELIGYQPAGTMIDTEVTPGTVVQIMTGAPLPPGADAVVKVESTETVDDHVVIQQEFVIAGENVRPVGFDYQAGDLMVAAGSPIGPAEIGLLASIGIGEVEVRRKPRVTVISTGDELIEPGEEARPGAIRDSNRFSLVTALQAEGAEIVWAGKGPDDTEPLQALLRDAIASSDVVITSGGVSMGELDLVKKILGDLANVHFRRIFLKPGKPLNFATADNGSLIFGLPGNPVSALVAVELFIRAALRKMTGRTDPDRPRVRVTLQHDITPGDRIEFQRAVISVDETGQLYASATGAQGSSRVASLVGANALLMIPPRETDYLVGESVTAMLVGPLQVATVD